MMVERKELVEVAVERMLVRRKMKETPKRKMRLEGEAIALTPKKKVRVLGG